MTRSSIVFIHLTRRVIRNVTVCALLLSVALSPVAPVFAEEIEQAHSADIVSDTPAVGAPEDVVVPPAVAEEGVSQESVTTPVSEEQVVDSVSTASSTPEDIVGTDVAQNQEVIAATTTNPTVPTGKKFKKSPYLSKEDELAAVRQHLTSEKLPRVALDRLDAFEAQQTKDPEVKGFFKKAFDFVTGNTAEAKAKKEAERLIKEKPFMVETFDGNINTASADTYKNDFSDGQEQTDLIQKVKNLIKNGAFLNADFNTSGKDKKTGIVSWLFGAEPAMADVSDNPNDYLSEGNEVVFSQAIQDKADELNNNPLEILNFVRNNVTYIPYYGSKKGAGATLAELAGNDIDKSSLLIAMLRHSNIPARYKHADVKIDLGTVTNLLGVRSVAAAAQVLSLEKIPYTLYTLNDEPAFFVLEHSYVEAYIPYGVSRGADMNDGGSPQWIAMDPSVNSYYYEQPIDLLEGMRGNGFTIESFFDDYLGGAYGTLEPLEAFRTEVAAHIASSSSSHYPDLDYEGALLREYAYDQPLDFIPASLPYEVSADLGTYDFIPSSLRHTVTFTVADDTADVIEYTTYVSELADKEILVTYNAATEDDQDIIDSFDTIYDVVPLSVVAVVPVIKVGGVNVVSGTATTTMGRVQTYTMDFTIPTRAMGGAVTSLAASTMEKNIITGTVDAVAINTDRIVPSALRPSDDVTTGSFVKDQVLYKNAVDYLFRLQSTQRELASVTGGDFTHTASRAVISNGVDVSYVSGQPYSFDWIGLRIDARSQVRYFNRFSGDGSINLNRKEFIGLFGLQASQDESDIFEDNFAVGSVATVKGLRLVADGTFPGITLRKITTANESDIDTLSISTSTKSAFHDAIDDGMILYTPSAPVTYEDWEGLFYIAVDFDEGEATYAIGEGLNGGYTAIVGTWPGGISDVFIRAVTLGSLSATIASPFNNSTYNIGEDIPWAVTYHSSLFGIDWSESITIDTKNAIPGTYTLRSGYGTNAAVSVKLKRAVSIGKIYNDYDDLIAKWADEFEIPRGVLKAIIHKETESSPFDPKQYRYEPKVDYDNFSGPIAASVDSLSEHPYRRFSISGHTSTMVSVSEGAQLSSLDPVFTKAIKGKPVGWGLRGIKGYVKGQTYAQLRSNDTAPGSQAWPSTPDNNFTAQVVLSASYGMGHVLYISAVTIAKTKNGDVWFDTTSSGDAVNIYDMNDPDTGIHLAASVLYYKKQNTSAMPGDSGDCDGWGAAVRGYNGSSVYRDDVCDNIYTKNYK